MALIDVQGGGKPTRPSRQIANPHRIAVPSSHQVNAFQWFQPPQQNACADAWRLAGHVDQPARAVGEMHVRMPPLEEKRTVSRRFAAKRVSGGISGGISLRLHDASAHAALGKIMHQSFADQEFREFECLDWKLSSPQAP